jgi:hypothetical protein
MFGLFAVYNLYLVATGRESCDCLGAVKVRPVYMLLFDGAALVALGLRPRPGGGTGGAATGPPSGRRTTVAGMLALAVGGVTFGMAVIVRLLGTGGGVAVVGDLTHHFGEVPPNQQLTHTFGLQNSAREPVEVVQVRSSCGCTTTDDLAGQLIQPGEVKAVPVSLRSGIVDAENIYGDITVYYRPSGGGETAYRVLRVSATVRTDFNITPTQLDFGSVAVGQTATRTISLLPAKMAEARVTATEMAGESFRVEPLSGRGRDFRITYSPRPALRSGPDNGQLMIRTNSPNVPFVYVSVLAWRAVPAEITPLAVVVGSETRGTANCEVTVTADKEFDISRVDSDDSRVTARQKNPGCRRAQILVVTIPDTRDAPVNANLKLTLKYGDDTTDQEAYRVSVPVHRLQSRDHGE